MTYCKFPFCQKPVESKELGYCASHAFGFRKSQREEIKNEGKKRKRIAKVSIKKKSQIVTYSKESAAFIKGKRCPVNGQPAVCVHHKKGRIGYADQWARDHGITLVMDKRYWLACSLEGHRWIEEHPHEARQRGWSLPRTETIQDQTPTI